MLNILFSLYFRIQGAILAWYWIRQDNIQKLRTYPVQQRLGKQETRETNLNLPSSDRCLEISWQPVEKGGFVRLTSLEFHVSMNFNGVAPRIHPLPILIYRMYAVSHSRGVGNSVAAGIRAHRSSLDCWFMPSSRFNVFRLDIRNSKISNALRWRPRK